LLARTAPSPRTPWTSALGLRDPLFLAEPEPRVDLLAAADDLSGGLAGTRISTTCPHTGDDGARGLHGCHVSRPRQQSLDGRAAHARYGFGATSSDAPPGGRGVARLEAVVQLTEARGSRQAVIGSQLQRLEYQKRFYKHAEGPAPNEEAPFHTRDVRSPSRGEYILRGRGKRGPGDLRTWHRSTRRASASAG